MYRYNTILPFSTHCPEQRAQGHLGTGACASEIIGVGQSSNVTAMSGKHYFHQSNFYFRQHHFHPEKIYLLREIFSIDLVSISVKEGLFSSKQRTLRNNSFIQG